MCAGPPRYAVRSVCVAPVTGPGPVQVSAGLCIKKAFGRAGVARARRSVDDGAVELLRRRLALGLGLVLGSGPACAAIWSFGGSGAGGGRGAAPAAHEGEGGAGGGEEGEGGGEEGRRRRE